MNDDLDHGTAASASLQRPDQTCVCQVPDPFAHVPPLKTTFIAQLPVYTDDELAPLR